MEDKYKRKIEIKEALDFFNESFVTMYENAYKKMIPTNELKSIIDSSKNIAMNSLNNLDKNTLIVGSVQSGKTSFFLSLIAHLLDNKSNIGFVFPATDNILFNQTLKRFNNVFNKRIQIFTIKELQNDESKIRLINQKLKDDGKIIILGLKNKNQIDIATNIVKNISNTSYPFILDDEGDQASFDDKTKEEDTATYNALTNLFNTLKDKSYFSVTATPYAHIFVNKESTMKPDFAFLIPKSKSYIGINWYHDHESESIRIVSEKDSVKMKELKLVPNSLKTAITEYFMFAALKHLLEGKPSETSFLMHSHRENASHANVSKWLMNIITNLKKDLTDKRQKTIDQVIELLNNSHFEIDFEIKSFIQLMIAHIDNSQVVIGNQKNKEFSEILKTGSRTLNNIYVGSQMLQRGVTLPNLLVTYFTNRTSQTGTADTIMQRARWFGYRDSYKFITKLYLTEKIINDFQGLLLANDDMHARLEELKETQNIFNQETFEERLLVGDADLKATRPTVAPNGKIFIPRVISDRNNTNSVIAETLWDIIKNSSKKIKNELKFDAIEYKDINEFKNSLYYNEVINEFKFRNSFETRTLLQHAERKNWRVIFMNMGRPFKGYDDIRTRSLINNKISNLMQGRSHEGKIKNYYFGDTEIFNHKGFENALIFQIHKINLKDSDMILNKIVIVMPETAISQNIFKEELND